MKQKLSALLSIILLVSGLYFRNNPLINVIYSDLRYLAKTNERYIANEFSLFDIEKMRVDDDVAFLGYKEESSMLMYVVSIDKQYFETIDASEGIDYKKALESAYRENSSISKATLIVDSSYTKEDNLIDHLYWMFKYTNGSYMYVDFTDGEANQIMWRD